MRILRAYRRIFDLWRIKRSLRRCNRQLAAFERRYGVKAISLAE